MQISFDNYWRQIYQCDGLHFFLQSLIINILINIHCMNMKPIIIFIYLWNKRFWFCYKVKIQNRSVKQIIYTRCILIICIYKEILMYISSYLFLNSKFIIFKNEFYIHRSGRRKCRSRKIGRICPLFLK